MEPVYNLILIVIGSFLGVTISLFLLTVKSIKSKANLFLGVYIFFITINLLQGFFFRFDWLEMMPHIVHLDFLYKSSAGALIYLYIRACTEKDFKMKPILWLHFIPLVLSCFYMFPWLMTSGEEKVAFYLKYIFELELGVAPWFLLSQATIVCVYLVFSFRLIQQYKKHLSNEASSIDHTYHRWLLFFALSTILPIVAMISWAVIGGNSLTIVLILTLIFLFILSVHLAIMLKPEIFHTFPNRIQVQEEEEEAKKKYESSTLQDSKKKEFIKKLVTYMETEKPYKEADLTLSILAERVNIPSHYLSQVINEKMKVPFLDFVNGYRVEEAKKMLRDENYENYTIIAVAYEAGFNSKTAFYSAFKKYAGMTPSAFRKGLQVV